VELWRQLSNAARAKQTEMMACDIRVQMPRGEIEAISEEYPARKKFTNKNLSDGAFLPHVVGPQDSSRYNLLFAVVHRFLPGLFTAVRMYSQL
jgi:hypothetical protein